MNISAGSKSLFLTMKPIATGTQIDDRLPIRLSMSPVRQSNSFFAIDDTRSHVIDEKPLPEAGTPPVGCVPADSLRGSDHHSATLPSA
jgi:hypothetical protein